MLRGVCLLNPFINKTLFCDIPAENGDTTFDNRK